MSVTRDELAGAIAYSLDLQIGMLFPDDATPTPTSADFGLADSLLDRFEITPKS